MTEISAILELLETRPHDPAVLVTLVKVAGSSYRRPGARLLCFDDGRRAGGISGGCLEEDVLAHAREVFQTRQPKVVVYNTASENDLVWGTGTGCDGQVKLLLEYLPVPRPDWLDALAENHRIGRSTTLDVGDHGPSAGTRLAVGSGDAADFRNVIPPPQRLIVFGAGDDAQPLVAMAAILGWQATVVDSRGTHATAERFPQARQVVSGPLLEAWSELADEPETPLVLMTHRYRDDRILLPLLLSRARRYVGVLGPRKRTERLLAELAAEGFTVTEAMRNILHAPVGLHLGGSGPSDVALAILAEIQSCLTHAVPTSLRTRPGPIHA